MSHLLQEEDRHELMIAFFAPPEKGREGKRILGHFVAENPKS
jgi:hypothetical protein